MLRKIAIEIGIKRYPGELERKLQYVNQENVRTFFQNLARKGKSLPPLDISAPPDIAGHACQIT